MPVVPMSDLAVNYGARFLIEETLAPFQRAAAHGAAILRQFETPVPGNPLARAMAAMWELFALSATTHARPAYGIAQTRVGNREVAVEERVVDTRPFGRLLHFAKADAPPQPRVLMVAPMSGHFSTLLRDTVRTMLPDHDVYITDWANARDVPLSAGAFGFDDYVTYLIDWLRALEGRSHLLAVCQPAVATLAAAALMAAAKDPQQPRSMTLMAGPIDTRVAPTRVNALAQSRPIEWFERELLDTVPWPLRGAGRRVYPGHTQLAAFMSMNLDRHVGAQFTYARNVVAGQDDAAHAHRAFYEEYLAVMDLPAEFYIETVARVFQRHELPRGEMHVRNARVDPGAIRHTFLLTIEGEVDDICALGQTQAALDLCTGLRANMKRHHMQLGAGHYGVFSGRRWRQEVYPIVREVIGATA